MHPPYDKRVFEKEAVYLAKNGFDVTHLTPLDGESAVRHGVKIVAYKPKRGIKGRILQLVNLYKLARSIDADVYHCNEVDSWAVGVALKLFRKKPCVFDVHEHYAEDFAEMRFPAWFRPPVKLAVRILMWVLSLFTDRVVLAKSSLESDFKRVKKEHVILVQNFTPLSAMQINDAIRNKTENNKQNASKPLKAIHLGLFNKSRGLFEMLAGVKQMENVELLFLGEYSDGTEDQLHKIIESYGLVDRVQYKPWAPFEEAMNHVRNSDVGLIMFLPGYHNHTHALPHKLFDYMAAGIPVIAPKFAVEVSEIIDQAKCGLLVDSSDPMSLQGALENLIANPESIRLMGKNGKDAIRDKYNWEAESDKLVAMYNELAAER